MILDVDVLIGLLVGLQLLDVWTTKIFLSYGIEEGNPMVKRIINLWGENGLTLFKTIAAIFISVMFYTFPNALVILGTVIGYTGLIIWNSYWIYRMER